MLTLDVVHDFAHTQISNLEGVDPKQISERFAGLEAEAHAALEREGLPEQRRSLVHSIDMRYEGQEHTITVPLGAEVLAKLDLAALRTRFDEHHEVAYGYSMEDPVEVTGYRIRAVGTLEKPKRPVLELAGEDAVAARIGSRSAFHRESGGRFDWSVYSRAKLRAGNRLRGPAIVEESSATTVVAPDHELSIDELGNLVIERV